MQSLAESVRIGQLLAVSGDAIGSDDNCQLRTVCGQGVDEISERLTVDGRGPVLALDQDHIRWRAEALRALQVADSEVDFLCA